MTAGVVLSLGLALGSLPMPGITAAEPDAADILNAADAQNVTAETPAGEIWAQTEIEALTDGAVSNAQEASEDVATAAAAAGATEVAAGQSVGAALDSQDTAEEIVLPETDVAEFSAAADGADAGDATAAESEDGELFLPEDSGLISGIKIIAIEEAGTAAADDTAGASAEASTPVSGDCGVLLGTVTWELDESGTLKVSGSGDMLSWESPEQVPWDALRGEIRGIEIAEGVTSVGAYAFCGCDAAEIAEVAESVSVIGEAAFSHCSGFTTVSIG